MREVTVVSTGIANTASVAAAFRRLGANPQLERSRERVAEARFVVLPGVGSFSAGMKELERAELLETIRSRVEDLRPTLGICLGMQLLFDSSEESPGVGGLRLVPGVLKRFPDELPVPQLGWNDVLAPSDCRILQSGTAYFANSFRLTTSPPGWLPARSDYGGEFVSAIEKGPVLACQFHPELSGSWGLGILERWLDAGDCKC